MRIPGIFYLFRLLLFLFELSRFWRRVYSIHLSCACFIPPSLALLTCPTNSVFIFHLIKYSFQIIFIFYFLIISIPIFLFLFFFPVFYFNLKYFQPLYTSHLKQCLADIWFMEWEFEISIFLIPLFGSKF